MIHKIPISNKAYTKLFDESTDYHTIELRAYDENKNEIKENDIIVFLNVLNGKKFSAPVQDIRPSKRRLTAFGIIADGQKFEYDSPCDLMLMYEAAYADEHKINLHDSIQFKIKTSDSYIKLQNQNKIANKQITQITLFAIFNDKLIYVTEDNGKNSTLPVFDIDANKQAPLDMFGTILRNDFKLESFQLAEIGRYEVKTGKVNDIIDGIMYVVKLDTLGKQTIEKQKLILTNPNVLPENHRVSSYQYALLEYFQKLHENDNILFGKEANYETAIKYYDDFVNINYEKIDANDYYFHVIKNCSKYQDVLYQRLCRIKLNRYNIECILDFIEKQEKRPVEYLALIMSNFDNEYIDKDRLLNTKPINNKLE